MTLQELRTFLRPTGQPTERPTDEQLLQAETKLGLLLPDDYRQFVQHYGTGSVENFLRILNPCSQYRGANLVTAAKEAEEFDCYFSNREAFLEGYDHCRYPEAEGLLPWAHSMNGDILYWLTQGDCESWPVVVSSRGKHQFYTFSTSMTGFVGGFVTKGAAWRLFGSGPGSCEGQYVVPSD